MMNKQYDVVVCGGGVAGIAAALAAARAGARTCLLEREYALGGLATLGLIVIYLPLCDGTGVQMSSGLAEELLRLSIRYGPGNIPPAWAESAADRHSRAEARFKVQYQAAPFVLAAEEQLLADGVDLLYSAQVSAAETTSGRLDAVWIETKQGRQKLSGRAFVDATGDADLLYFAGESTFDDATNRRTAWYFSYDGCSLRLHQQTDPLYSDIPQDSRLYSGTDIESISQHCIDGRRMILNHMRHLRATGHEEAYPLMIPAFHGLRMTRRLDGVFAFSEALHDHVWFEDAIGMIGNWKKSGPRYSIPYRSLCACHTNLYAAGRCTCADKSGWDLTRVIPTCAVTGEAAGAAAALQARWGQRPDHGKLQQHLSDQGVLLDERLFSRQEML
ncbi:MAG: FAD-dependent oxidoreductase [Ruminococcaceae bacterium]|jgi:hypothetical protein|nr:FAD-dependent oxidoreductase [Oscillospiraceae bacterium]